VGRECFGDLAAAAAVAASWGRGSGERNEIGVRLSFFLTCPNRV
jgi:hypothetical protein